VGAVAQPVTQHQALCNTGCAHMCSDCTGGAPLACAGACSSALCVAAPGATDACDVCMRPPPPPPMPPPPRVLSGESGLPRRRRACVATHACPPPGGAAPERVRLRRACRTRAQTEGRVCRGSLSDYSAADRVCGTNVVGQSAAAWSCAGAEPPPSGAGLLTCASIPTAPRRT